MNCGYSIVCHRGYIGVRHPVWRLQHRRGWVFVTDDFQARKAARALGVPISGTIGVLIQAVKQRLMPTIDADSLLLQMIANGYHSPHSTISELLA